MKKTRSQSSPPANHAQAADRYARAVLADAVPAGPWVKRAAERHFRDLERAKGPDAKLRFDPDRGARVCRFIEQLPHVKGRWAKERQKVRLEPWQCFVVVLLFGWLRLSASGWKRRFRYAYLEIPRKNGKSLLAAGIGLYMQLADGEHGAEVYSGATTEKQAWEVFGPAKKMLEASSELREFFGAEVCAKSLIVPGNGSKFEPIIGNPGDGSSPSCAIVDEFHEHDTPALYDTMETGMGAREQPLLLVITTAGRSASGPCHEKHDELCKVLDRTIDNDDLFGVIFGIAPEDDWVSPRVLIKANPNYGVSVDGEFLQSQQRQALLSTFQQTKFKTKHLNVWCSVRAGWMDMMQWAQSADPLLDEDELAGSECVIAIDLASKSDLCCEQRLYLRQIDGKPHYYLFGRYWLPEAAIEEPGPNAAHYAKWVRMGLLTQTDGATVDFEQITEQVLTDCRRLNPREVVYDPFNATQMAQALMREGITAVEFVQNPANFAVPMDDVIAAVKDGRFHHDGNEITTWCMSNTVAKPTRKGLFWPAKQMPHQKIDGTVAVIMAMGRLCTTAAPPARPAPSLHFI